MMMKNTIKGALIASAVCAMFTAGISQASEGKATKASSNEVKCAGINECKGHGACSGAGNSCSGQNGCKGQGWVKVKSAKECTDKGGTVVAKQ
jgi:uncharacterized membrane protein